MICGEESGRVSVKQMYLTEYVWDFSEELFNYFLVKHDQKQIFSQL